MSVIVQALLDENDKANVSTSNSSPQRSSSQLRVQEVLQQKLNEIENLRMEYIIQIGSKLLLLLEFVELNVEAIVKIVKKHDKLLSRWEESNANTTQGGDKSQFTRLRRQYLPRFAVYSSDPNVRCLFLAAADAGDIKKTTTTNTTSSRPSSSVLNYFGGWDVIQGNLERGLRELYQWERGLQCLLDRECVADQRAGGTPAPSFTQLSSRSMSQETNSTEGPIKKFLTHSSSLLGLAGNSSPSKQQPPNESTTFFEPILYQIQSSRKRLGQMHNRYIRMVAAHEMLHLIDDDKNIQQDDEQYFMKRREEFGSVEKLERIRKQSIGGEKEEDNIKQWMMETTPTVSNLSKYLNLASSGLYMMNYNIVAPTSGLYAELLGFDPANAGIIIGMTPMAVILSSVLYSWWSSYSYKRALVFASFCCACGNIVYALALPCNSLKMVLLGRLLTGFGSARVINRRYIGEWKMKLLCIVYLNLLSSVIATADYYSIENRTSGMADFVSASAAGMAFGPGLAAALSIIAPPGESDSKSIWTLETAPGYVMCMLWSIYLTLNICFFEEPERQTCRAHTLPKSTIIKSVSLTSHSVERAGPMEDSPLLKGTDESAHEAKSTIGHPLLKSCGNIPVLISLVLLVLLKCVLEGISSSAPAVSHFYFNWGTRSSGIFLAILASCVLPTNFSVAYISRRFDDRELIMGTLMVMFIGIIGFLVYSEDGSVYSESRFILFGILTFVACNALEGPTMGLLSKTIPKSLAKGILNAGLLATEAGTLGRVVGDCWLANSTFKGMDEMVNRTFEPMCLMVGLCIVATFWSYPHLQPRFEDEDDD